MEEWKIEVEDITCGEIISSQVIRCTEKEVNIFRTFNDKGEITGYKIRDLKTGKDIQL